jgi:serine/threonine protein phosphatase PrpC
MKNIKANKISADTQTRIKPNKIFSSDTQTRIKLCADTQIGRGHIKSKTPCQDMVYTLSKKTSKGNYHALALCDGAGSQAFSHIGAKLISQYIVQYILANFNRIYTKNNTNDITKAIEKRLSHFASINELEYSSLASTLEFVAILDDRFIAGHIGDGVIGYIQNDTLEVLSHPDNGEFANSTFFTTSNRVKNRLRIYKGNIKNISGFILMSDGTSDSFYDMRKKELVSQCKDIIHWLRGDSIKEVKKAIKHNLEKYISQRTQDDCSLGLVYIKS